MNKIIVCLAVCSALQACSSSSDMSGSTDQAPVLVPGALQPTPGSTGESTNDGTTPDNSGIDTSDSGVNTSYDAISPQHVANSSNIKCDASIADFQSTMLAVINDSRLSARMCGAASHAAVDSVMWNDRLTAAAVAHAGDMVRFNFFDHTGSDGLSVSDRADSAGYNWRAVGENIAAGQIDVEEVHDGWLASPGHCRNIMNPLYTEVGAACIVTENADFGSYWVVVFGDQP